MFATTEELQQYARLTFKQHKLEGYELVFLEKLDTPNRIGQANPWEKKIELSPKCLESFALFRLVFLHELAHILQFYIMGETYRVNGRNNFHGKVFKECCKKLGISHK